MTRNELIATFSATNTRPEIVSWLKAANQYQGHSRDGMADLKTHMSEVAQGIAAELESELAKAAKVEEVAEVAVEAPKKVKAPKAKKAVMYNHPKKPVTHYSKPPTRGVIDRMRAAVASVGNDESGTKTLTDFDLVISGNAAAWARKSNQHLADANSWGSQVLAACGYTGRTSRGLLVLTPIATEAAAQAS